MLRQKIEIKGPFYRFFILRREASYTYRIATERSDSVRENVAIGFTWYVCKVSPVPLVS
jgi:hypothetical protein